MKDYQSHEQLQPMAAPERPSDRSFGLVFGAFLGLLGLLPLLPVIGGGDVRWWLIWPAAAFLLVALIYPRLLMPVNRIWWRFALLLQAITTPILMGLVFLLAVTPMGWVMRRFRDPLRRRMEPPAASYWITRTTTDPGPESLLRQF